MLPILESGEETLVGGQAVMEGVMMRAPHSYCVAVRKPNGRNRQEEMPIARMSEKYPCFKWPVLRGLGALGQAMSLGMKALTFSANAALDDGLTSDEKKEMPKWVMVADRLFSHLLHTSLQIAASEAHRILSNWAPVSKGQILFNVVDGVIRIAAVHRIPAAAVPLERYPAYVRISRRGAQSGVQFRIRQAGYRG